MISIALGKVFGFWQLRPHFQLSSVQLSSAPLSSGEPASTQFSSAHLSSAKLNLGRFLRLCTAHKMRPFINDFNCAQEGFWLLAAPTPFSAQLKLSSAPLSSGELSSGELSAAQLRPAQLSSQQLG